MLLLCFNSHLLNGLLKTGPRMLPGPAWEDVKREETLHPHPLARVFLKCQPAAEARFQLSIRSRICCLSSAIIHLPKSPSFIQLLSSPVETKCLWFLAEKSFRSSAGVETYFAWIGH